MPVRIDEKMDRVLGVFRANGNCTTGFLVDETDLSRPTVTKRLDRLHAGDHIEYLHKSTALWRLVDDPREE